MAASQKSFYLAQQRYMRYVRTFGPTIWLPMREKSGGVAFNHAYIDGIGPELLTNGDFSAWTADDPDSWTIIETPPNSEVARDDANDKARIVSTDGTVVAMTQAVLTAGETYELVAVVDSLSGGSYLAKLRASDVGELNISVAGRHVYINIADTGSVQIKRNGTSPTPDGIVDSLSVKKIGEADATIGGTTSLAQTGQMGVSEAFLLNGATSLLTIANRASIQGLSEFALWALFNPASAGEGNAGTLFSKSGEFELRFNSANRDLTATVNYDTTNSTATTTTSLATNE